MWVAVNEDLLDNNPKLIILFPVHPLPELLNICSWQLLQLEYCAKGHIFALSTDGTELTEKIDL